MCLSAFISAGRSWALIFPFRPFTLRHFPHVSYVRGRHVHERHACRARARQDAHLEIHLEQEDYKPERTSYTFLARMPTAHQYPAEVSLGVVVKRFSCVAGFSQHKASSTACATERRDALSINIPSPFFPATTNAISPKQTTYQLADFRLVTWFTYYQKNSRHCLLHPERGDGADGKPG